MDSQILLTKYASINSMIGPDNFVFLLQCKLLLKYIYGALKNRKLELVKKNFIFIILLLLSLSFVLLFKCQPI